MLLFAAVFIGVQLCFYLGAWLFVSQIPALERSRSEDGKVLVRSFYIVVGGPFAVGVLASIMATNADSTRQVLLSASAWATGAMALCVCLSLIYGKLAVSKALFLRYIVAQLLFGLGVFLVFWVVRDAIA